MSAGELLLQRPSSSVSSALSFKGPTHHSGLSRSSQKSSALLCFSTSSNVASSRSYFVEDGTSRKKIHLCFCSCSPASSISRTCSSANARTASAPHTPSATRLETMLASRSEGMSGAIASLTVTRLFRPTPPSCFARNEAHRKFHRNEAQGQC